MFFSQESLMALEQWIESFADYESLDEWRNGFSPFWQVYWQPWFPYILDDIHWDQVRMIDSGGCGVVFEPGAQARTVVKLAYNMDEGEIIRQNHFARQGKAVPVFHYVEVSPPPEIAKLCCSKHGVVSRRSLCTCREPIGAALMPRVEPLGLYGPVSDQALQHFMDSISSECWDTFEFSWEPHERNIARFQGKLVALDFGDTL